MVSIIVLQIPLIKGESVTSDIPVKDGKILLNLGPNQTRAGWVSSLSKREALLLKAVDTLDYKASKIDFGIDSVNSYIHVKMPQNRWILFCSGPCVGPAVLFWSSVFVLALLSLVLGRLKIIPLKNYHWFLLGLGLTQVSILAILPVAAWLIALGLRNKNGIRIFQAVFCLDPWCFHCP